MVYEDMIAVWPILYRSKVNHGSLSCGKFFKPLGAGNQHDCFFGETIRNKLFLIRERIFRGRPSCLAKS
jgi:hypothetical protein